MHRGYIKLWRKIEDWSWFRSSETLHVFVYLLIRSNHKDSTYQGYPVPRGSCVCGRKALASTIGLSERSVRTALKRLKTTNEVTIKTTNRFSIISIVNYDEYQEKTTSKETNKVTLQRPTNDQQTTTSKECKNEKNEKNKDICTPSSLEEAKKYFQELGNPSEAENFFDFYASKGWIVGRSPMKSWKHAARRWVKNQKNFVKKGNQSSSVKDFEERMAQVRREKENAKLYC